MTKARGSEDGAARPYGVVHRALVAPRAHAPLRDQAQETLLPEQHRHPREFPTPEIAAIQLSRNGYWERRTPVRRGLCSTPTAGVIREIAPHWGAALPDRAGLQVRLN